MLPPSPFATQHSPQHTLGPCARTIELHLPLHLHKLLSAEPARLGRRVGDARRAGARAAPPPLQRLLPPLARDDRGLGAHEAPALSTQALRFRRRRRLRRHGGHAAGAARGPRAALGCWSVGASAAGRRCCCCCCCCCKGTALLALLAAVEELLNEVGGLIVAAAAVTAAIVAAAAAIVSAGCGCSCWLLLGSPLVGIVEHGEEALAWGRGQARNGMASEWREMPVQRQQGPREAECTHSPEHARDARTVGGQTLRHHIVAIVLR